MKSYHLLGKFMLWGLLAGIFGCSKAPEVNPDPTKDTRSSDYGGPTDIVNAPPTNGRLAKSLCNPKHGEFYSTDYGKLNLIHTRDSDTFWDKKLDELNGTDVDFFCEIDEYFLLKVYSPYTIENISDYWSAPEINATKFYKVKYGTQVDHKKLDGLGDAAYDYILDLKNNHSEAVKDNISIIGNLAEVYIIFTTDSKKKSPSTRGKTGILRISNYMGKGGITMQMWKEK